MISRIVSYLIFVGVLSSLSLFFNACEAEEAVLLKKNKIVADSLIGVQTRLVAIEIDSLCKLVYQNNFDHAVDSISAVRLQEIEKYIPSK